MSLSRRKFLQVGAVAAVSASAPLSMTALAATAKSTQAGLTKAVAKSASSNSVALMNKAQFEAHLNTTFFISTTGKHELPVRLVKLEDRVPEALQEAAAFRGRECFALGFAGPTKSLRQDTYRIRHASLGEFDIFLGLVKDKKHGMVYEAVINHLDM